ncbi:bleomycin resistance protein [Halobacteriales archaeon QS_4_62_28]|nr:MAG: bleomycin resistance protein [Halobacteriales archaeon QS_4_62_28]
MPTTHHVGTTVEDLDRAVEFYSETFGFEELARFDVAGEAFATGVGVPGAAAQFAHLDGDGVRVELVSYDPGGEDAAGSVNDTGAKHLGIEVEDIEAFYADLGEDIETLSAPQTSETGSKILFVKDPEGNLIEVIEPA